MARAPVLEEERPPPDALEGVPLPRQIDCLVGHEAAETALLDAYRSNRMHHAWIILGEPGIGKATLAFRLARFLLANPDPAAASVQSARDLSVPPGHPAARKVAAGVHPNVLHLQRPWDDKAKRYRSELSIDAVRRLIPFLGSTAGEDGWRIVIVDPATDMNRSAANALLKALEEPPARTVFLLLATSRGGLLPTILSRCRTLSLAPLPDTTLRRLASEVAGVEAADDLALKLAGGSVRRLVELAQSGGADLYQLLLRAVDTQRPDARMRLAAAAADAATFAELQTLLDDYLTRRVRGEPEPAAAAEPAALPLVTWMELWEKARDRGRDVDTYNLDRKQFVLNLLEEIAAATAHQRA